MQEAIEVAAAKFREALDYASDNGFLIIASDYGVKWDEAIRKWVWDPTQVSVPGCCAFGAYVLRFQPEPAENGDVYETVQRELHLTGDWMFALLWGFENLPYVGSFTDPFQAGLSLNNVYRPVNIDFLTLTEWQPLIFEEEMPILSL